MKQKIIFAIFFLLVVVSGILITQVNINYNLEKYLPKDSEIKKGMDLYRDNFGESSFVYVAIDENNMNNALAVKQDIKNLDNVANVFFIDDYLNELTYSIIRDSVSSDQQIALDGLLAGYLGSGMTYPEALNQLANFFPIEQRNDIQNQYKDYVSDSHVLFQVIFFTDSSSVETEETLEEIRVLLEDEGYEYRMKGDAASTIFTKNTIAKETTIITIIIIPIIIIILLLLSKSLFDIVLFAIVAGVAIIINLGTNALFPDISYITQSMAIALQLAISLDYIIFTLNSYHKARSDNLSVDEAITTSLAKTRRPVIASALTTGVSFLALVIMKFQIGLDIGLVFAKAIMISLLTTLFLLPVLIKNFARLIDKTKKKSEALDFARFANFAEKSKKFRYFFLGFILLLIAPLIYFQTQNEFTYGVSSFSASEGTEYYEDSEWIDEEFGKKNTYTILTEKNDALEASLYQELSNLDFVYRVDAGIYYKSVISDPVVLAYVTDNLYSEEYALYQVTVISDVESEQSFVQYEEILDILDDSEFTETFVLGETAVSYYIKEIILRDFTWVLVTAILAVLIIIFFSFKNLLIPIILIVVIEVAVFLSMSLINIFNQDLVFLGYLIVTTILLGATIDYAILFAKRYMEEREEKDKATSIRNASLQATPSIVTSALLFIVAGLTISMISSITSIAQIGLLIAIGAFVAMIFVLVILPQLLYIFDRFIVKSKF